MLVRKAKIYDSWNKIITGNAFKYAKMKNFTYCFLLSSSNEHFLMERTPIQQWDRGGYLGKAEGGTEAIFLDQ